MNKRKEFLILCVIGLVWLAGFIWAGQKHVSWRDEYQSWMVSTRTETWPEFFEAVRFERHPPLHYLLQRGAHAAANDIDSEILMKSVTYAFSVLNVVLILFFFPASILMKICLVLGIGFTLEYGIISRTYAIGVFFLFSSGIFERAGKKHWSNLALALTSLTHLYFTLIAGAILAFRFWPNWKKGLRDWSTHLTMAVVFISLFCQRPPPSSAFTTAPQVFHFNPFKILKFLGWGITGIDHLWGRFEWNDYPSLIGVVGLAFIVFLWKSRREEKYPAVEFLLVVAPCLLIMNLAYSPYTRHVLILWMAVLYFTFRSGYRPPLFRFCAVLMVIASLRFFGSWQPWKEVPQFDFSGQREVASQLGSQLKDPQSILVTVDEEIFFPVAGALGISFFSAKRDRILPYPYFKTTEYIETLESWCAKGGAEKLQKTYRNVYLGMGLGGTLPETCKNFEVVFESRRSVIFDEHYKIFQLN